jgi:hypothetical protein
LNGFFKLNREIFDHDIWKNPIDFRLFLLVIGNAVFSEEGVEIEGIKINRGQWLRSYRNLQKDLEYKEKQGYRQHSISTIKRSIDRLIYKKMVRVSGTEKGTLFEVVNYEKYQGFQVTLLEESGTGKRTGSEQVRNKNNNDNNANNDENAREGETDGTPETEKVSDTPDAERMIGDKYLERKKAISLSNKDMLAIERVTELDVSAQQILDWIDEIFDEFEQDKPWDKIQYFAYCENAIETRYNRLKYESTNSVVSVKEYQNKRKSKSQRSFELLEKYRKELESG